MHVIIQYNKLMCTYLQTTVLILNSFEWRTRLLQQQHALILFHLFIHKIVIHTTHKQHET